MPLPNPLVLEKKKSLPLGGDLEEAFRGRGAADVTFRAFRVFRYWYFGYVRTVLE